MVKDNKAIFMKKKISFLLSTLIIIIITFFSYNYIDKKKREISILKKKIIKLNIEKGKIATKIGFIPFKYLDNIELDILDNSVYLNKYKTGLLNFTKGFGGKGSSYLDTYNNQLYLISANGLVAKTSLDNLQNKTFDMKIVDTNIYTILNEDLMYEEVGYGIKDIFIDNNKVFISFVDEIKKNCYNLSILEGKITDDNINFKYFFKPESCIKKDIEENFSLLQSGGRIINFDNENLLVTFGEFRSRLLSQDLNTINGKIIKINKKSKIIEIISIGHRNPQGLTIDKKTNIIYSSEHGPKGGDEINIIYKKKTIQNFGWPIASYGEHYDNNKKDNSHLYKTAPLFKSHKNYGFIEPAKNFTPSIGISELILFNIFNQKTLMASSLGNDIDEGDMSLHIYLFDEEKLTNYKSITINERIRDMVYIEKKNLIVLFLETTSSIGLIKF